MKPRAFFCTFLLAAVPALIASPEALADGGIYSAAQATRGEALYQEHCSACHGGLMPFA